jgi:NAD(P)-dependent dehydrogenase (short-subunit alcohol dehydrogenase family)
MAERGKGVVVNVSSVNALTTLGNPAYSVAKAGLLRSPVHRDGIRAQGHSLQRREPRHGADRERQLADQDGQDPDVFAKLERWYPVGRVGQPADSPPPSPSSPPTRPPSSTARTSSSTAAPGRHGADDRRPDPGRAVS